MVPKSSLSLGLLIVEGLLDKNTWVWNCNVSRTSLRWFVERKLFIPCSSIWNFDRGKLVILSVFIEFHILETIVKSHIQVTKVVRRTRNEPDKITTLLAVTSSFKEIFKIS